MGLCTLHEDHKPSFLVDPLNNLFYCYGCDRGGDVIRFAELYHQVRFPQALVLLCQWLGLPPLLREATEFYRIQLHVTPKRCLSVSTWSRSPEVIEHMRIGYAPGGCLRGWLTELGYSGLALREAGLVTAAGYDTYMHRVVFPLEGNLYGRSLTAAAPPHRFLPGAKVGCTHGARSAISGSDSGRGTIRLRRIMAGRLSQCHLLDGHQSQRAPASATLRWLPNRLSGL